MDWASREVMLGGKEGTGCKADHLIGKVAAKIVQRYQNHQDEKYVNIISQFHIYAQQKVIKRYATPLPCNASLRSALAPQTPLKEGKAGPSPSSFLTEYV